MNTILVFLMSFMSLTSWAQNNIGIGTNNPNASSILDITSNDKGFLLPRMSTTNRLAISNPSEGLLVFDSTQHRLYQVQDGQWRYMLTNSAWTQSANRNWTYNGVDSVGIGISAPSQRLDVNGTVQSRQNFTSDGSISAVGTMNAGAFSGTALSVGNDLFIGSTVNGLGRINLQTSNSTLQFQNNSVNKAFLQLAGNDLRLGTNAGNAVGKIIFRLNGVDAMSIDRLANMELLQNTTNKGELIIGWKVSRVNAPDVNMLPVVFGFIPADGNPAGWMSPFNGEWAKLSTGVYEVSNYSTGGITPSCVIVATPTGNTGFRLCTAAYLDTNKFRVDVFDENGNHVDGAFTFVVNNPLISN